MKINSKVAVFGFVFLLSYIIVGFIYFTNSIETLYDTHYKEVSQRMQRELDVLIKEKLEAVLLLNIALAQHHDIKIMLMRKNYKDLELDKYSQLLRENTSLNNIWFHVVDNTGVSRYRSWTPQRGDSIVGIRKEMAEVLKEQKIYSAISTGKFDMTFKSMVPVYSDEKFLGVVETIARFNSIVKKLQKYKFETLVLIDKSYKKQLSDTLTDHYIQDYYISSSSGSTKLMDSVVSHGIESVIATDSYLIDEKNQLLLSVYLLRDVEEKKMGYFIMSTNLSDIDISNVHNSKKKIILGLVLVFIIITGFLTYLYMVNYRNFLQRQQKELEEKVVKKTKELREKSDEMTHLAYHDPLTKLPNRLLFSQKLREAIAVAKEEKQKVGVLFLDLDGFKEINDTYGHKSGDLLLQKITRRLKKIVPEEDMIARFGGDEFTVIVQNATYEELEKIAQKIIEEIQKPLMLHKNKLFMTFSVGLSVCPDNGDSSELLLKHADTAMYRAKDEGKNRYQFYDAKMTETTMGKVNLQNQLRDAIEQEQFEPYYQPKIDARSGKVVGLEALVRWNHPQRGLVPPMDFIPFAEESDFIKEIDQWMLYATLKQMKAWHKEGLKTGRLSVNISTHQLRDFVCVECFKDALSLLEFDASYLEVEVTESQVMKNQLESIEVLQALKKLGVTISMDDFGTGYSSLSYLKNLPVDRLKIDRSFIMETPQNKDDVAIVKTIIALSKNLGLDIIAEGVETKEQVDLLVSEGCYDIQGYYFSKPLSAQDCRKFLKERS